MPRKSLPRTIRFHDTRSQKARSQEAWSQNGLTSVTLCLALPAHHITEQVQ